MNTYLKSWNFARVLRLALAVLILAYGIIYSQWMFIIIGFLLAIMPVLNIGCTQNSGCKKPTSQKLK